MTDTNWIRNVTAESFEADVVEASQTALVLVDFWAPWCQPCRQLTPLIEQIVAEQGGKVLLAKVDIDQNQALAQAARVQSIPFVLAIRDGQPLDQFAGMLPEPQLREWVQRLLPSPAEETLESARAAASNDPETAERYFREAIEGDPDYATAKIEYARFLLERGRNDESLELLEQLQSRGFLEPEATQLLSQLELRRGAEEAGGLEAARRAAAEMPQDVDRKLRLMDALAAAGEHEEALRDGLAIIESQSGETREAARQSMLRIFDTLGPDSELTREYRRKLASALF